MFLFIWAYHCCHLIESNYRLKTAVCFTSTINTHIVIYPVEIQSLHVHHVPVAGWMDNKQPNRKCWTTGHLPSTCQTKLISLITGTKYFGWSHGNLLTIHIYTIIWPQNTRHLWIFFLLIFNFYCQFEHYTKCHLEAVVYMATHRQVKIFEETYMILKLLVYMYSKLHLLWWRQKTKCTGIF